MAKQKIFTKRHARRIAAGEIIVHLDHTVRRRFWFSLADHNYAYYYYPRANDNWTENTDLISELPGHLMRAHGTDRLVETDDLSAQEGLEAFVHIAPPQYVFDALELFYDDLHDHGQPTTPFEQRVNEIFDDAAVPWRMSTGRIFQVDSKFLEEEVLHRSQELMQVQGFDGALAEFQEARSALSSHQTKPAIHNANNAVESVMKSILGVTRAKPGELIRSIIDSGIVPDYYDGFLRTFEQHVLRAVAIARNDEPGVGHGQGLEVNDVPYEFAELVVNLAGAIILFLIKCSIAARSAAPPPPAPEAERLL